MDTHFILKIFIYITLLHPVNEYVCTWKTYYEWSNHTHQKKTIKNTKKIYIHTQITPRSLPGFSRLRMHTKGTQNGSVPVAFIEFKDAACAGSAMAALQGTFLLSSERGAIRIEYAKSKMVADAAAAIAQLDGSMCFIQFLSQHKFSFPSNLFCFSSSFFSIFLQTFRYSHLFHMFFFSLTFQF